MNFGIKRRRFAQAALLGLLSLLPSAGRAQDLGNVGLRSVSATIANNVTCTGSAQQFSTANPAMQALGFRNLGQTSHLATATSTAAAFQMEIDGIDSLGNIIRLSDLQLGVPSSAKGGIAVTASGYMANIQVSITCTAAAVFSASYSGSFSPSPPNVAGALLNSIDKLPFQTSAANASSSTTFQSPTGNSAGTIIFQYSATGPAGSTVTAQCLSNSNTNLQSFVFPVSIIATAQLFVVTPSTCPFVTLSYSSGGASAVTYNLEYAFNQTGTAATLSTPNVGPSSALPIMVVSDASSQAFAGNFVGNAIAVNSINAQVNANNGSHTVYMQRAVISTDTTETIFVDLTSTTGTGCSISAAVVTVQNLKFSSTVSSTSLSNGSPCTTQPTTGNGIYVFNLTANTSIVLDLSGIILPAGSTQGIAILTSSATAVTRSQFFWYEK